eukprot:TRINITY_DN4282_c0_g1_i3.p1 TRINITY_DN4282_c0_g1~~TRINITY_DN4282_c0_g1_i3.p1  ORF type:complete len:119 (-),score=1.13 TRINITY_DN4282_c0_g1_i3:209-565(-)
MKTIHCLVKENPVPRCPKPPTLLQQVSTKSSDDSSSDRSSSSSSSASVEANKKKRPKNPGQRRDQSPPRLRGSLYLECYVGVNAGGPHNHVGADSNANNTHWSPRLISAKMCSVRGHV